MGERGAAGSGGLARRPEPTACRAILPARAHLQHLCVAQSEQHLCVAQSERERKTRFQGSLGMKTGDSGEGFELTKRGPARLKGQGSKFRGETPVARHDEERNLFVTCRMSVAAPESSAMIALKC